MNLNTKEIMLCTHKMITIRIKVYAIEMKIIVMYISHTYYNYYNNHFITTKNNNCCFDRGDNKKWIQRKLIVLTIVDTPSNKFTLSKKYSRPILNILVSISSVYTPAVTSAIMS